MENDFDITVIPIDISSSNTIWYTTILYTVNVRKKKKMELP